MSSIIVAHYKNINNDYTKIHELARTITGVNFIVCHTSIFMLYNGKIYNPPYFLNILIVDDEQEYSDEKIHMVFNMLLIGGFMIVPKRLAQYCYKAGQDHLEKISTQKNYVIFKRKTNLVIKPKKRGIPPVDFIIMGTQKSGTTSAQKNLALHPEICLYKDEIHYFDLYLSKGLNWYKEHFDYSKKIVGEKTPELMYLESTYPYIQSLNPSLKIIIFLRNPIHRAYSAWKMMKHDHGEHRSFEECIQEEQTNRIGENKNFNTASFHHLQRGLYYAQISNLLKWFPRQNLLVMLFENVAKDTKNEYAKIYEFLNVSNFDTDYTKERPGSDESSVDPKTYAKLIPFFQNDVASLEGFLGYRTGWFD